MSTFRAARLFLAVVAFVIAGCGGTPAGGEQPPASLDPNSPKIAADALAFDRGSLTVPASRAFTLVFENRENVPHNVSIYADSSRQDRRFEGSVFNGPATRWYAVPALTPGTYYFFCDVHPAMTGSLVAA